MGGFQSLRERFENLSGVTQEGKCRGESKRIASSDILWPRRTPEDPRDLLELSNKAVEWHYTERVYSKYVSLGEHLWLVMKRLSHNRDRFDRK